MDIWVIDTCSIIHVRRIIPAKDQKAVYAALTQLVDTGVLRFPREVLTELQEATDSMKKKHGPDLPYEWAKLNRATASADGFDPVNLTQILKNKIVARVVDPEKSGKEEADPYVLELGTRLRGARHTATVITEDKNDKPTKTAVRTACGLLGIPSYGLETFLEDRGIVKR